MEEEGKALQAPQIRGGIPGTLPRHARQLRPRWTNASTGSGGGATRPHLLLLCLRQGLPLLGAAWAMARMVWPAPQQNSGSTPGHKVSHKKTTASSTDSGDQSAGRAKVAKINQCSVCFKLFPTGQAVGGHKRCHWDGGVAATTNTNTNNSNFSHLAGQT
ncbi:hypothetical protein EJ110_NYTH00564 [Nymphaea thermarum]|nr:hypothetical protein EJ110_NYTH00564 [Nymphaea thermarum]